MTTNSKCPISSFAVIALALLSFAAATGCSAPERTPLGCVVEPEAFAGLVANDHAGTLVVLDARDAAAYQADHVAAAIRVDPDAWKNDSLGAKYGLDQQSLWSRRIGALGVNGRDPVVVYDDGRMTEAARVWFILQYVGAADVAVLDGGFRAIEPLIAAGRLPVSRNLATPNAVDFAPPPGKSRSIDLVDRQHVRESIDRHETQVFDARTPEEFSGKDLRKNARGGHLPTAINVPHKQLLDEDGRLRSPDALARMFEQAGFKRGQPIITHCDGGGRASLAALAAKRAGYGPVENYYLSFGDWAADASCPIERGDE